MKLKGIRTIALLLAVVFLIGGSVTGMAAGSENRSNDAPILGPMSIHMPSDQEFRAGISAAGGENRSNDEEFRMDARYWWEEDLRSVPLYQRKQVRDIMVLILDRYFGIDISRMTSDQLDEVATLIGNEGQEKVHSLFEHYAHKKGFEMPEPPEPPAPLPVEDVYWWEIVGHPEKYMEMIMEQIAEAKGMSPNEVEKRFGELFPSVDLGNMTFDEFDHFLESLPRPPFRPLCLEEVKHRPSTIAVFGRVAQFSTEAEMREFDATLKTVIHEVIDEVSSLLRNLSDFRIGIYGAGEGTISVAIYGDVPTAEEIGAEELYEIISEKAESLFGIEDVAVVFSGGVRFVPPGGEIGRPQLGPLSSLVPSSSGWQAPWNERFRPILGAVKNTGRDPASTWSETSTISFAVRRFIWWRPWDWWDEDYIVTGHIGPGITPINTPIYQPTVAAGHEAGRVADTVGPRSYADAARVAISDHQVRPYILIGGAPSRPALNPVVASADPAPGATIWISAARSGLTFSGTIMKYRSLQLEYPWPFDKLYNGSSRLTSVLG